jgi:hypothetical protein
LEVAVGMESAQLLANDIDDPIDANRRRHVADLGVALAKRLFPQLPARRRNGVELLLGVRLGRAEALEHDVDGAIRGHHWSTAHGRVVGIFPFHGAIGAKRVEPVPLGRWSLPL